MKLSSDALERIKQTVREAEIELKRAISQLGTQASFAAYLRIFTSFACAKFDAEAGEWISACGGDSEFADLLDRKIKPRIIESILPDQSLSKVGVWSREKNANIVVHHDMDNGTFWEADESGIRRPARKEIQGAYAPHGEWENFVDDHLRFALRFPADNKQAREALAQSLQRRIFHWVGRFQQRVPIEIVGESSDSGISGHPEDSASTADTIPDSTPREIVKSKKTILDAEQSSRGSAPLAELPDKTEGGSDHPANLRKVGKGHSESGANDVPEQPKADHGTTEAQSDAAKVAKQTRAATVARLIKELHDLRPQMFDDESEYESLRAQYPEFLTFRISDSRPDLKRKVLAIQGSTRHIRLAQELAAAHHQRQVATIKDDWKDHKPPEFKRQT